MMSEQLFDIFVFILMGIITYEIGITYKYKILEINVFKYLLYPI